MLSRLFHLEAPTRSAVTAAALSAVLAAVAAAAPAVAAGDRAVGSLDGDRRASAHVDRRGSAEQPVALRLDHCNPTVLFWREPRGRLDAYVHPSFTIRSGLPGDVVGSLDVQDCSAVSINGGTPQPTMLAVLGVRVQDPDGEPQVFGEHHDVYVAQVLSDNMDLVHELSRRGIPAHHVRGMSRTPQAAPGHISADFTVPWTESPFSFGGRFPVEYYVHDHNLSYWFVDPRNNQRVELELLQYGAVSQGCGNVPVCSSITATEGSVVAEFLGAAQRSLEGWDHRNAIQKSRGTLSYR